jgi:hypothetical protein
VDLVGDEYLEISCLKKHYPIMDCVYVTFAANTQIMKIEEDNIEYCYFDNIFSDLFFSIILKFSL